MEFEVLSGNISPHRHISLSIKTHVFEVALNAGLSSPESTTADAQVS